MTTMLEVTGLTAGYDGIPVLHDVSFEVEAQAVTAIIGSNGAGKTTLLRTLSGVHAPMSGKVVLDGGDVSGRSTAQIGRAGLAHVPENRRVFPGSTVEDNLRLGAYVRRGGTAADRDEMYARFPILRERRAQKAGSLSGGQQQMLAIAMALMAKPKVLLLDEPSLGLAPIIVDEVFEQIEELAASGVTVLLVEQLADRALAVADTAIVLSLGRIVRQGPAGLVRDDPSIKEAYLGA